MIFWKQNFDRTKSHPVWSNVSLSFHVIERLSASACSCCADHLMCQKILTTWNITGLLPHPFFHDPGQQLLFSQNAHHHSTLNRFTSWLHTVWYPLFCDKPKELFLEGELRKNCSTREKQQQAPWFRRWFQFSLLKLTNKDKMKFDFFNPVSSAQENTGRL